MLVSGWVVIFLVLRPVQSYIETIEISGCESCKLQLTCRHLTSMIAIFEATFTPNTRSLNETNSEILRSTGFPPYHPRQALNQRCSGVNHCSFILTEDCPGAASWGAGKLSVKYVCVSENQIKKFCNSEISIPPTSNRDLAQGFIHNPGYPRFYSSQAQCYWKITVPPQQRIKITILDIALTGITTVQKFHDVENFPADQTFSPDECSDHLDIVESEQIVETVCKSSEPPMEIISDGNSLDVALVSTHSLMPLRGVLLHYTAIGCAIPEGPEDSFLVFHNETTAEFSCYLNKVFKDDGRKTKILECVDGEWSVALPLPNCTENSNNSPGRKNILLPFGVFTTSNFVMGSELLAPILLIVALFLINSVVLFYIYKVKKRQSLDVADEELKTLRAVNRDRGDEKV